MKMFKILLSVLCVAMVYALADYSVKNNLWELLILVPVVACIPLCILVEGFANWFGSKLENLNG